MAVQYSGFWRGVFVASVLGFSVSAPTLAQACDVDAELERLDSIVGDSATTVTDSFCGYEFTAVSDTAAGAIENSTVVSGSINGVAIRIESLAPTFGDVDEASDIVVIFVEEEEIFRGVVNDLDLNDGLRLLQATGLLDSAAATQTEVQRTSVATVSRMVSRRIQQFINQPYGFSAPATETETEGASRFDGGRRMTGLAGGDGDGAAFARFGVWGNVTNSWLSDTSRFGDFSGTLTDVTAGFDYRMTQNVMVGVALTGEFVDLETYFNDGDLTTAGVLVSPYIGAGLFDNQVIVDGLVGYGYSVTNTERRGFAVDNTGAFSEIQVDGDFTSHRLFFATNVTGNFQVDAFTLSPRVGYQMAWDHRDRTRESDGTETDKNDTVLGTVSIGGRATYTYENVAPYIEAEYLRDVIVDEDVLGVQVDGNDDRDEVVLIGGITWFAAEDMTAIFEVSNSFGREDFNNTNISATFRWQF